jgi:hypothetical protein
MLRRAMTRAHLKGSITVCACALAMSVGLVNPTQTRGALPAPIFEVDPFWPKPLPNHWVLGASVGVWVDAQDHIWMIHRGDNPNTIKGLEMKPPFSEVCCATAPRVLEFDQKGNLLRHWGPGPNDP